MSLLKLSHLSMRFGGLMALVEFHLEVPRGALYGLIGPNGAGKTTVFNIISGFLVPTHGQVVFAGQDVRGRPPHHLTALGIARTFQNIRLFKDLSVLDNVLVGYHLRRQTYWWEAMLRLPRYLREERRLVTAAWTLLEETGLAAAAAEKAGQLPYGHQRRLELARALATRPRLLLLDEPAAGLNPQETQELLTLLKDLHTRHGLTLLVIEHNMRLIAQLCQHLTVLNHGLTIAAGSPHQVLKHPDVIRAYLGD